MRDVIQADQFTPFGIWIRQYLRDSKTGLTVTNLDYIFEDYKAKKIMLVEEKQNGGRLHTGQMLTFKVLDYALTKMAEAGDHDYDYWGFYTLKFPKGCSMPGPGMTLNDNLITGEQLTDHLNFKNKFCEPLKFKWKSE